MANSLPNAADSCEPLRHDLLQAKIALLEVQIEELREFGTALANQPGQEIMLEQSALLDELTETFGRLLDQLDAHLPR
ncbi:MAG TPA: hypothetical protein VHB77_14315 [Planctomycetaceae bacterium]|nr:hypothetical protein [Planctomycetaceae bacterium]